MGPSTAAALCTASPSRRQPRLAPQLIPTAFLLISTILLATEIDAIGLAPGLYCGLETCYDVLGIPRETFNKTELPKIYRRLARQHHPDKVRSSASSEAEVEEAQQRFRLIATAYETLKDDETRTYYDYYLDHPEERYYNYYQYYRMRAAPKVDLRVVLVGAVLIISAFQYLSAQQKYSEAMRYAKEQVKFRNMATDMARQRGILEFDRDGKVKKKQKNGIDPELVLNAIIEENISISGGYKRQSIFDTLAWQLITFPLILFRHGRWWARWVWRFWVRKEEYDEEAKLYLIRRNLGMSEAQFHALEERQIDAYLAGELWRRDEFTKWKESKDVEEKEKLANSGRYRQYRRLMKKQAGSTISFLED